MACFFILPIACKKDKTPEKTFCELNPDQCAPISEAKDFFLFKIGSWWVYEEETSKVRDSMYVTECTNTPTYDFDARYKSALTGYEYHYYPIGYAGGVSTCSSTQPVESRCIYIMRSKMKPFDLWEDICFMVNYKVGYYGFAYNNTDYLNDSVKVRYVYGTYHNNFYNFNKTIVIHENNTVIEGKQPTNHYFSKGVGLIRKELIDSNQVWNLVNYHIE
ncbi:MAG: hypothetical protein HYR91_01710 [Flavobacteriia bacterium]|nr:hypothetical protein [Flavobacteriia bacterium]